jgi:hypothetical protein
MREEVALLCGHSHTANPELIAVSSMMRKPFRKGWLVRARRHKNMYTEKSLTSGVQHAKIVAIHLREQAI